MPNHIQSNLKFLCDENRIREILESVMYDPLGENEERGFGTIDFERITPMPEELDIEYGSRTIDGVELYLTVINPNVDYFGERERKMPQKEFDVLVEGLHKIRTLSSCKSALFMSQIYERHTLNEIPSAIELGAKAVNNFQKHGVIAWYDWRIKNWGTHWNSYGNSYDGGDVLHLQTAWSAPKEAIKTLSAKYPDVGMELEYADEDIGSNCGRILYKGGEIVEEYYPETEVEAIEYACSVWEYDPKDTLGLYKNASGNGYILPSEIDYELIEVCGKPALFTNGRITENNILQGMYVYYLRQSDNGDGFATIEPKVVVNLGGSVITKESLDFGEKGYIDIADGENSINFCGCEVSLRDFFEGGYEQDEGEEITLC